MVYGDGYRFITKAHILLWWSRTWYMCVCIHTYTYINHCSVVETLWNHKPFFLVHSFFCTLSLLLCALLSIMDSLEKLKNENIDLVSFRFAFFFFFTLFHASVSDQLVSHDDDNVYEASVVVFLLFCGVNLIIADSWIRIEFLTWFLILTLIYRLLFNPLPYLISDL